MTEFKVERTRSVLFMKGIRVSDDVPFTSRAFRIQRFTEGQIASWMNLRKRVTRKVAFYEDGTKGEQSKFGEPWWDVREDSASDPAQLCNAYALDFGSVNGDHTSAARAGRPGNHTPRANIGWLLLRLSRTGELSPVNEMLFFNDELTSRAGTVWNDVYDLGGTTLEDWAAWHLDTPTRRTLSRTAMALFDPLLASYHLMSDDCFVASEHFRRAVMSSRIDREINLWISMEAMFGVGSNQNKITEKLTANAAAFVADAANQLRTLDFLRTRYRTRCALVHGSYQPSKDDLNRRFSEMFEEHCELENIVRRALRRYLRCRLVAGVTREKLHEVLAKARGGDRADLDLYPGDPALDAALDV